MSRFFACGAACLLALVACARTVAAAPSVPAGFTVENAFPGVGFNTPTAIAFLPDGRVLVAEKRGVVWVVKNGAVQTPSLWNAEAQILNNGDRGLVGMAVDPNYATNRRLYFFYTVDPDSDGVDAETYSYGRLVRYETKANDPDHVDPASRVVLFGASWRDGSVSATLSHGAESLRFGADGSLLVSLGEGAHFDGIDFGGRDSLQFLPGRSDAREDIGSYRAQDPASLAGKVLRINPATGRGYASNPFAAGNLAAPEAKVWAMGFRNPFRFCVRPGSGSADTSAANPGALVVGDVGLNTWEEIDVADRPGMNFGWPCMEGREVQARYAAGGRPAHHDCRDLGSLVLPTLTWNHDDSTLSVPPGVLGNCTSGGVFYTGDRYPAYLRGRLFFGDFGGGWLKVATLDAANAVVQVQDFGAGFEGPVDWATDPVSGDLFYVSIYTGEVRRMRYTGGANDPARVIANGSAAPVVGVAPLDVTFSTLGSYDTGGLAITNAWSFGDGVVDPAAAASLVHTYAQPGEYTAVLTVANPLGTIERDTVRIVVGAAPGFPTTRTLDAFDGPDAPLGSPWAGGIVGLAVQGGALVQTSYSNAVTWGSTVFPANQEVWARLDAITASAPEQDLLLKVQGKSWTTGAIQIVYSAPQGIVVLNTYAPATGWARRGGPWTVSYAAGDVFGARAYSNGVVQVYKNGAIVGTTSVAAWPMASLGGRVGLMLRGATATRIGEFGGGAVRVTANEPPHATILSPADGSFYVAGQSVVLRATGSDEEDPASALHYDWFVDLHHNNHVHPGVFVSSNPVDSLVAEDHDDGTGVHEVVRLVVTDTRGAKDTAMVAIHPEVDLAARCVTVAPKEPTGQGTTTFSFTLANRGRMPAPMSRWAITANGVVLAQGDTLVAPLDSVRVTATVPSPAVGQYEIRAVADTLGAVHETDETNNGRSTTWGHPFPMTIVRDAFARDGRPQDAWAGGVARFAVQRHALVPTATSAYVVWDGGVFAADQEVWARFDSVTANAPEQDLLLKVQGKSWTDGAIQVVYSAPQGIVVLNTYTPSTGWSRCGGPWTASYVAGDVFGARAYANGTVAVYKNGAAFGTASVVGWPGATRGGRIGLMLRGADQTRIAEFGGGSVDGLRPSGGPVPIDGAAPASPSDTSDVAPALGLPVRVALSAAWPNPARSVARMDLELPRVSSVRLDVFDLGGRRVDSVADRVYAAGRWRLAWPESGSIGVPAGLYFLRVQVDGQAMMRRVTVLR